MSGVLAMTSFACAYRHSVPPRQTRGRDPLLRQVDEIYEQEIASVETISLTVAHKRFQEIPESFLISTGPGSLAVGTHVLNQLRTCRLPSQERRDDSECLARKDPTGMPDSDMASNPTREIAFASTPSTKRFRPGIETELEWHIETRKPARWVQLHTRQIVDTKPAAADESPKLFYPERARIEILERTTRFEPARDDREDYRLKDGPIPLVERTIDENGLSEVAGGHSSVIRLALPSSFGESAAAEEALRLPIERGCARHGIVWHQTRLRSFRALSDRFGNALTRRKFHLQLFRDLPCLARIYI